MKQQRYILFGREGERWVLAYVRKGDKSNTVARSIDSRPNPYRAEGLIYDADLLVELDDDDIDHYIKNCLEAGVDVQVCTREEVEIILMEREIGSERNR